MKRHGYTTSGYALTSNDRWVEAALLRLRLPRARGRLVRVELSTDVQPGEIRGLFVELEVGIRNRVLIILLIGRKTLIYCR